MKSFPPALKKGYRNFLRSYAKEPQFYRRLAEEGQKPEIMVIGCCDSRAAPEIIFQSSPGDIFVFRNIANQVPPFQPDGHFHGTSAALEYAVKALKVKHILVLGHGRCGGIQAALESGAAEAAAGAPPRAACGCGAAGAALGAAAKRGKRALKAAARAAKPAPAKPAPAKPAPPKPAGGGDDFIGDWMRLLKPAVQAVAGNALMTQHERQQALERISLRFSMRNLRSFPWISAAEAQGKLALHAAWFDIASAELWLLDEAKEQFFPLL